MTVESPCKQICVMDPVSGYCIGCARTLDEIATWSALNDQSKRAVVEALPERMQTMTSRATRSRRSRRGVF